MDKKDFRTAVITRDLVRMEELLQEGIPSTSMGYVLETCISGGYVEEMDLLFRHGAADHADIKESFKDAANNGRTGALAYLLLRLNIDQETINEAAGYAMLAGQAESARLLFESGAKLSDSKALNDIATGMQSLGDVQMVELALDYGADIEVLRKYGTPFVHDYLKARDLKLALEERVAVKSNSLSARLKI